MITMIIKMMRLPLFGDSLGYIFYMSYKIYDFNTTIIYLDAVAKIIFYVIISNQNIFFRKNHSIHIAHQFADRH